MVSELKTPLGIGLYTPAEAALYAGVTTSMMTRWVHGGAASEAAVRAQLPDDENRFITFLDLVQTLAVRSIRLQKQAVPLQKIRAAIEVAQDKYGISYPFARRHSTYIYGKEVLIDIPELGLLQMTGKHAKQFMMKKVIELYMEKVEYGADGLATKYTPAEYDGVQIVMNPRIRFGEPLVASCGITARTLYDACVAEGSIEDAAKAYEVRCEEVRAAFQYIDSLEAAA